MKFHEFKHLKELRIIVKGKNGDMEYHRNIQPATIALFVAISLAVIIFTITFTTLGVLNINNVINFPSGHNNKMNSVDSLYNRNDVIEAILTVDSLSKEVEMWRLYAKNISDIMAGNKERLKIDSIKSTIAKTEKSRDVRSKLDSVLRSEIMSRIEQSTGNAKSVIRMYPPIAGKIESSFNPKEGVIGMTITAMGDVPVTATDAGAIISITWTSSEGYIIYIQHANNFISIYKGVSIPLKSVGTYVKARDVIGYMGAGEQEQGLANDISQQSAVDVNSYNLYYELWQEGRPLDPEKYIIF